MVEVSNTGIEPTWPILGLWKRFERDGKQTQGRLAPELRVALEPANAYLRHCIRKGLIEVHKAQARLHTCYLTLHGFSERSRLTFESTPHSLALFRQATGNCVVAQQTARERSYIRIALLRDSQIAERAATRALNSGFAPDIDLMTPRSDLVSVNDIRFSRAPVRNVIEKFRAECVLIPALLGIWPRDLWRGA